MIIIEGNYLSVDGVFGCEGGDLIENGKEGKDVLPEVILVIAVGGARVEPARLDHEFEQRIEDAQAFLNGILFLGRLHPLRTLAHAAQQTTATATLNPLIIIIRLIAEERVKSPKKSLVC